MKEIARDTYLKKLIEARDYDLVKIVTGMRRSGKSYLLDPIFKDYLLSEGVPNDHIIKVNLEEHENATLRDPDAIYNYVKDRVKDDAKYYVLLDEIQLVPNFESVLSSFLYTKNIDTYATGSNSKFLSSDIITEFRGRSEEIRMWPFSFAEFYSAYDKTEGSKEKAWTEYYKYGGLPQVLEHKSETSKMDFLLNLQKNIYLKDVIERNNIKNTIALSNLVEIISSSVGSLTNPRKLERTFKSKLGVDISHNTLNNYLEQLENAFLIEEVRRFDVKGKHYIDSPQKYYFTDSGIRNSFVGFRQVEENHVMENIIYNELRRRDYQVDIGVVGTRTESGRKQYEIDFVANRGDRCYYIQSALTIGNDVKREQESKSLDNVNDHFTKIIISRDTYSAGHERNGIVTLGLLDFLLNYDILDNYQ